MVSVKWFMSAFYEYTTVRLLVVLINTRAHQCLACGNSDCAHKSINSPNVWEIGISSSFEVLFGFGFDSSFEDLFGFDSSFEVLFGFDSCFVRF